MAGKDDIMSTATAEIITAAHLDIRPLQPTIGAEIHGLDIAKPISAEVRDAIRAAVLQYKVVFFRDQQLDNESHAAFARQFGPLYTHPSTTHDPKVTPIHTISALDNARFDKRQAKVKIKPGEAYHSDTSWRLVPTWGAVLRAVDLPPVGGDTVWVDAHLAYEGLSDELKERLEGLHVTHDYRAALLADGQHGAEQMLVVAHPPGHPVHGHADGPPRHRAPPSR